MAWALARIHVTPVDGLTGFDAGWCRLDLFLLFDERIADRFLASYQAASGTALPDPLLWDLWAAARSHEMVETWVPNYRDLGRTDLTARELRKRHTAWTDYLMSRGGGPRPLDDRGRKPSDRTLCQP
jgi:hypothetical protein